MLSLNKIVCFIYNYMNKKCSGNSIPKKALLSMIGENKFNKKQIISNFEVEVYEINENLKNNNIEIVSSRMGLKKSSLKRKINTKKEYKPAYDETFSTGLVRKYLEKSKNWKIVSFDSKNLNACVETGPFKVKISISVPNIGIT